MINKMGNDFNVREPWGTLITNHQARSTGYDFFEEPWSDIVTLEEIDEVVEAGDRSEVDFAHLCARDAQRFRGRPPPDLDFVCNNMFGNLAYRIRTIRFRVN